MANSPIVIIAHLVATNKTARDQILDHFHTIAEHSRVNEPGVLKYASCLPDNAKDETAVYVIEEYLDKPTYDAHMSLQPVTSFIAALQDKSNPLITSDTKIYTVAWTPALLSRDDRLPSNAMKTTAYDLRARIEHPYILFATMADPDKKDIDTLEPYGAAIVKYATEHEPDTIFYADARPVEPSPEARATGAEASAGGFICAVEVYASKEACMKHLQDESVKDLAVEGNKLGSKFEIVTMVMKEGWLIRE